MKAVVIPIRIFPKKVNIPANALTKANLAKFLRTSWNAFLAAEQKQMLLRAI